MAQRTPASQELPDTESPPCPLCGDADPPRRLFPARDLATGRAGSFAVARCRVCGLAFTAPRPTPAALGRFYEGVYSGEGGAAMREMQTGPGMRTLLKVRWALLIRFATPDSETRLLDIGCGYGAFLALAHERSGCAVAGCDLDAGSLGEGVAPASADLRAAEVDAAGWENGSFDVVTLYHCLEHTVDPVATLRVARRLLKPGGLLVVEVPNFGGLWRRVFGRFWFPLLVPQHLVHFERPTLRRAVVEAGFSEVLLHRGFWAPFDFIVSLALVVKAIAGPPPEGRRPFGRWLLHKALGLPMTLAFLLFDLPLSLLLARTPLSGHQVVVARCPSGMLPP